MKTMAKRIRMLVAELMDTDQYWLEERYELIVETLTFLLLYQQLFILQPRWRMKSFYTLN
jgi:hypothetical protein